ncbi:MAG: zinc ribbon domain-containing protein [Gemmatimonadetes bacterium]|nr:zinc ribbon domain-containing protein [Gemmatimonadota bacterium]
MTDERPFADSDEELLQRQAERARYRQQRRRKQRGKRADRTGNRPPRAVGCSNVRSGALSKFGRYRQQRASGVATSHSLDGTKPNETTIKTGQRSSCCPHCGEVVPAEARRCPRCRDLGYCECGRIADHKEFDEDGQCTGAVCSDSQARAVWVDDPQVDFEEWLEHHGDESARSFDADVAPTNEDASDPSPHEATTQRVVDMPGPSGLDPLAVAIHDRGALGERVRPLARDVPVGSSKGSNYLRCDECSAKWTLSGRLVDWRLVYAGLPWGGLALVMIWVALVPVIPWPLKALAAVLAVVFGVVGLTSALNRRRDRRQQEAVQFVTDALTVGNAQRLRQWLEARGYDVDAVFAALLLATRWPLGASQTAFAMESYLAKDIGLPGPYESAGEAEVAVAGALDLRIALARRGHDLDILTSMSVSLEPLLADIDLHWPTLVPRYRGELAPTSPTRWVVRRPSGAELDPRPSQEIRNHSPDGFVQDSRGSGAAQLALAILLDRTGDSERSERHHEAFTEEVIGYLAHSGNPFELPVREVDTWLRDRR